MIVLDTNVLSEPLRPNPSPGVVDWLAGLHEPVAITSVSLAELCRGAGALPRGRRRQRLEEGIENVARAFRRDLLPFEGNAARTYARMDEARTRAGRPLSVEDGMIAAICASTGATLATRNVSDFEDLDIDLVNPWNLG
ncbi:type II toxin-antitoxin system VapC family toxin [Herbiconiux sp. A18JL235]|uniref:Ribonuclease VapC n=1 Tax=Herbiconiux sp. A18JL235 TaxID=3152363 RepID=A0AB39BDI3_9MICO